MKGAGIGCFRGLIGSSPRARQCSDQSHCIRYVTQEAFDRPNPVPTGLTPKSATAVAALAADATNETAMDFDAEDIMGGQGLVEAVFSGMFEDEFDGVMPIRNHKVPTCFTALRRLAWP